MPLTASYEVVAVSMAQFMQLQDLTFMKSVFLLGAAKLGPQRSHMDIVYPASILSMQLDHIGLMESTMKRINSRLVTERHLALQRNMDVNPLPFH